jgi:hypothetical protein
MFADYNVALCSGDSLPAVAPAFYENFAKAMNNCDDSGFGWAYLEDRLIVWDDESLTPADASSFCVLDDEIIDGRLLGPNETAVTTAYFRNAERLVAQDQRRETKYYEERQEKKNKKKAQGPTLADVQTKEGKADFARKRKALQDAAAARKQKVMEGSGAGAGEGSSHNMDQDQ